MPKVCNSFLLNIPRVKCNTNGAAHGSFEHATNACIYLKALKVIFLWEDLWHK